MLTEEITITALKLNAVDRAHLAETLLESLDKTDDQIQKIWLEESEKRYQAYKEGSVKGLTLRELRSRIEK